MINYKIISLGWNCIPRIVATCSGLKTRKIDGELSCPFDLCVTDINSLINILKNNFKDYIDGIVYDKNNNIYINKNYFCNYNHDTDCDNTIEGLQKIKERYKKRIENFEKIVKSNVFIYYFLYQSKSYFLQIKKLNRILKTYNKNFRLIVFSFEQKNFILNALHNTKMFYSRNMLDDINKWWDANHFIAFRFMISDVAVKINKYINKFNNTDLTKLDIINNCYKEYYKGC